MTKSSRVLVTGPNANSMRTLNGGWTLSWQGERTDEFEIRKNTILKSIENKIGKDNVIYMPGVIYKDGGKYDEEIILDIEEVKQASKDADIIIACVGENSYTEKPGDLNDLYLSDNQQDLVKVLAKTGKPIILVLNEGRPRVISKIEPLVEGIVQIYLPGSLGGEALADILWGDVNPSGKLPYTYPKYPNTLLNYDYKPVQSQEKMIGAYNYESSQSVQYPFGYGLSYTKFEYSNLKAENQSFGTNEIIKISVDVTNSGKMSGKESVLLFISDIQASITPDNSRLRGFEKISLEPGETKTVFFEIMPREIAFFNTNNKWCIEKGIYRVQIFNQTLDLNCTEDNCWNVTE